MKRTNGSNSDKLKFSKKKSVGRTAEEVNVKKDRNIKERELQRAVEEFLAYYDYSVVRIPDEAYRAIFASTTIPQHIKGIISAWLKGLPDVIVIAPLENGFNLALNLELKTATGKLSQGQKQFAQRSNVKVCRSFEDFQEIFKQLKKQLKLFKNFRSIEECGELGNLIFKQFTTITGGTEKWINPHDAVIQIANQAMRNYQQNTELKTALHEAINEVQDDREFLEKGHKAKIDKWKKLL